MPARNGQTNTVVVILILFIAVILGLVVSNLPPLYPVIFVLGLVIFSIALLNTNAALIILIFSMLLSPGFAVGKIPGRAVQIRAADIFLLMVFFVWMAKMAINKELGFLKFTSLNRPIYTYVFITVLATLLGAIEGQVRIKSSLFYLLKYFEYFLLFFMVVNNIKSIKQIRHFIFFLLLTCFLTSLYAWRQAGSISRVTAPFQGAGGEPNTLAGYLLLMMAIIAGLILYSETQKQRFILLGLLLFIIPPFLFTLSRGAWLGFFPMFLTLVVLSKRAKAVLVLSLIFSIVLLPFILPQRVKERIKITFAQGKKYSVLGERIVLEESASERIQSVKLALNKLSKRPIFGYGVPGGTVIDNQYARVLTEVGLVGFIIFIWLLSRIFKAGWHTFNALSGDKFSQGLSLGFMAGFVGLLIQALTSETFIIIRIMEPFWFLTAIVTMLPEIIIEEGTQANIKL